MKRKHLSRLCRIYIFILFLLVTACGKGVDEWVVASNSTKTVAETTHLNKLTIEENAGLTAQDGYRLTLTVDGVETGQVLKTWEGRDYKFAPGTYQGDIVLTVTEANDVVWSMGRGAMPEGEAPAGAPQGGMPSGAGGGDSDSLYPFRQALYLDADGIDEGKSVLAAVQGERPSGFSIQNIRIESKGTLYKDATSPGGTGFNGIYAAGGMYHIKNLEIEFFGDGRSDFAAQGAAVVSEGKDTRLVLENADVNTQGVVRSGVIAKSGSNIIVKNSRIAVRNGVLPPGWVSPMDPSQMRSTLWISGMTGTTRATSVLGTGTRATYIGTSISFEGWGGLSTDIGDTSELTAINCMIDNTGKTGYGQYNNSNAVTRILGCEFNVGTIGSASDSGSVFLGDSTQEALLELNETLELGLTAEELNTIPEKSTIINSNDQGILWHGSGCTLTITGGTTINARDTLFVDKGAFTDIKVDGSRGARLNPGNGVLMQVMDDDEPAQDPEIKNFGNYEEPTGPVVKDESHDIYTAKETDALAKFSNIELKGDFYNAVRGGLKKNALTGEDENASRNLGLTFDNADITGVISASDALHYYNGKYYPKIGKDESAAFSHVINTPGPAVNNGVIVTLQNGSKWTVIGTSYLTKLVIEEGANVSAPSEQTLTMTVDGGKPTTRISPGTYTGNIVLTVN